jgi:hypothetical protein
MRLNSTTLMRISGLILIAAGAFGIYSWQIMQEKVVTREVPAPQVTPTPQKPVTYPQPVSTASPPPQMVQPSPIPIQRQEPSEPQARPQYSYEQCWQIARRAANDESVAVPPECREAQADYQRRLQAAEEQRQQQLRAAEEERERQRLEQERIADQQSREEERRRYEAEQNRLRNEQAVREAQERVERERQERSKSVERVVDSVLNKIRRRPY